MQEAYGGPVKNIADHFWVSWTVSSLIDKQGDSAKGYNAVLDRMSDSRQSCEELRAFYKERIAIEEDYAKRLAKLGKLPLGKGETGWTSRSLQVVLAETDSLSRARGEMVSEMRSQLDDALANFMAHIKERKKPVSLERLYKSKTAQEQQVEKLKDKYESDCVKINGYMAQSNMLLGKELEKNNAKLEKTQVAVQGSNRDYQAAVRVLQDLHERWTDEWRSSCDKIQTIEEERLDFLKSSLWNYANIYSGVCVKDDDSCEKIRLALENVDVPQEISAFVDSKGTGKDIPAAPKYQNFHGGDAEDDHYPCTEPQSFADIEPPASGSVNSHPTGHSSRHSLARENYHDFNERAYFNGKDSRDVRGESGTPRPPSGVINNQNNYVQNDMSQRDELRPPSRNQSLTTASSVYSQNTASEGGHDYFKRLGPSEASNRLSMTREDSRPTSKRYSFRMNDTEEPPRRDTPEQGRQSPTVLGVGNNMFPTGRGTVTPKQPSTDPLADALERLDVSRSPAAIPKYPSTSQYEPNAEDRPHDTRPSRRMDSSSPIRTQVPGASRNLGAPPSAHTSEEMRDATSYYAQQNSRMFAGSRDPRGSVQAYPGHRDGANSVGPQMSPPKSPFRGHPPFGQPAQTESVPRNRRPSSPYTEGPQFDLSSRQGFPPIPMVVEQGSKMSIPTQNLHKIADGPYGRGSPSPTRHSSRPQESPTRQHDPYRYAQPNDRVSPMCSSGPGAFSAEQYGCFSQSQPSTGSPRSSPRARTRSSAPVQEQEYSRARTPTHPVENSAGQYPSDPRHRAHDGMISPDSSSRSRQRARSGAVDGSARPRSRSRARSDARRAQPVQYTSDGMEILGYVRALYDYQAAIPEEIGFNKDDTLMVLRMQEDGWWEGEVVGAKRGRRGLFPSNFVAG